MNTHTDFIDEEEFENDDGIQWMFWKFNANPGYDPSFPIERGPVSLIHLDGVETSIDIGSVANVLAYKSCGDKDAPVADDLDSFLLVQMDSGRYLLLIERSICHAAVGRPPNDDLRLEVPWCDLNVGYTHSSLFDLVNDGFRPLEKISFREYFEDKGDKMEMLIAAAIADDE